MARDETAAFGALISAMNNNLFPASDAEDFAKGADWIPGKVTDARRAGEQVVFVQDDGPWYWRFADGSTVRH